MKIKRIVALTLCMTVFFGCSAKTSEISKLPTPDELSLKNAIGLKAETKATTETKPLEIRILLSSGGINDKSFNASAIAGLDRAVKKYQVNYEYAVSTSPDADIAAVKNFASENPDLIIGVGFTSGDAIEKNAKENPSLKFAVIDSSYAEIPKNVVCITFSEGHGSFLAGVLAAGMSKSGVVGFVGGMNMPLVKRFEKGFSDGALYFNKNIKVVSNYVGDTPAAFGNPVEAKRLAKAQIQQGADVIYHASGGSGTGVFEATKDAHVYAIGVDSNQNWIVPGSILASMLKKVDVAVYTTVSELVSNNFNGGNQVVFGLKEGGVGLTDLDNLTVEETDGISQQDQVKIKQMKDSIPQTLKDEINNIAKKIINSEITID